MSLLLLLSLLFMLSPSLCASWDGTYQWINNTDKNNWGKVNEITMRVESVEEDYLYNLYLVHEGEEYRIFPLVQPGSEGYSLWHSYNEESTEAKAFRVNNKRMNTTFFTPGKWKMGSIDASPDLIFTTLTASAFGLEILVDVEYIFSLDENGKEQLTFSMDADQDIAKGKFFQNPDEADGSFTLSRIDS